MGNGVKMGNGFLCRIFLTFSLMVTGLTLMAAEVSPDGSMKKVYLGDQLIAENVIMRIAMPGWKRVIPFSNAKIPNKKLNKKLSVFDGILYLDRKQKLFFTEEVAQDKDMTKFDFAIRSGADIPMVGMFLYFHLPINSYKNCTVTCVPGQKKKNTYVLPEKLNEKNHIVFNVRASKLVFSNPKANINWELDLGSNCSIQLQDERKFGMQCFTGLITVRYGNMPDEQFTKFTASFQKVTENKPAPAEKTPAEKKPETKPATTKDAKSAGSKAAPAKEAPAAKPAAASEKKPPEKKPEPAKKTD